MGGTFDCLVFFQLSPNEIQAKVTFHETGEMNEWGQAESSSSRFGRSQ
jgi:hypothetical protein